MSSLAHLNNHRYHVATYTLPTPPPVLYLSLGWMILLAFAMLERKLWYLESQSTHQPISLEDFRSMWRRCKQISVLSGGAGDLYLRNYMSFGEDLHPSNLVNKWLWYPSGLWCFRYWNSLFTKQWFPFLHCCTIWTVSVKRILFKTELM